MRLSPYIVLGFGVLCLSWAAILIRLADAPSLVIAAYRLLMAIFILIPFTLARSGSELRALTGKTWGWAILSGALLAVHFASWISSLTYTSVASSVVLVTTYPIFVGIVSHFYLKERLSSGMVLGILMAMIGGCVIGYGDFTAKGDALYGDGLALIGALSGAGYFLIGRRLRGHVSLLPYITVVYTTSAVLLLILALVTDTVMVGYSWTTYGIILALALGPQLLGHSSLNWALKYLSAVFVSVSTLAEPVVSSALAFLILNEGVSWEKVLGSLFVLGGIYVVLGKERVGDESMNQ